MLSIEKQPAEGFEQVVVGQDSASGLHAMIAVHSTALGPSLGGVRMWPYANEAEARTDVLRLAGAMSRKAAISGLPLGGGKAVILGDARQNKTRELLLSMGDLVESLDGAYIAAEDSGFNCRDIDVLAERTDHYTGASTASGDPGVSTARGVCVCIERVAERVMNASGIDGMTVAIQGVGSVGHHLATMLHEKGAELIVADIDHHTTDRAAEQFGARVVGVDEIIAAECDVLAPCALGGVIDDRTIETLRCRAVVGGANNQLLDETRHAEALAERGILYAPDYLVNAGGLIRLHTLEIAKSDDDELQRLLAGIGETLIEILDRSEQTGQTPVKVAGQITEERICGV